MKRFRFLTISVLFPATFSGKHLPRVVPRWPSDGCASWSPATAFFFFKEKKSGGFGSLSW